MSLILIGDVVHRLLLYYLQFIFDVKVIYLLKLTNISETEIFCGLDQELIITNVYK